MYRLQKRDSLHLYDPNEKSSRLVQYEEVAAIFDKEGADLNERQILLRLNASQFRREGFEGNSMIRHKFDLWKYRYNQHAIEGYSKIKFIANHNYFFVLSDGAEEKIILNVNKLFQLKNSVKIRGESRIQHRNRLFDLFLQSILFIDAELDGNRSITNAFMEFVSEQIRRNFLDKNVLLNPVAITSLEELKTFKRFSDKGGKMCTYDLYVPPPTSSPSTPTPSTPTPSPPTPSSSPSKDNEEIFENLEDGIETLSSFSSIEEDNSCKSQSKDNNLDFDDLLDLINEHMEEQQEKEDELHSSSKRMRLEAMTETFGVTQQLQQSSTSNDPCGVNQQRQQPQNQLNVQNYTIFSNKTRNVYNVYMFIK